MIVRDGQVVATFTAGQLSDLTGHGQRSRGPGPLLADVLVAAHADDRSRSLVIDGYGGDQLTIAVKDVLDTPGDYPIFLTQRSTAKLDTPIGTVRHVSTITVRNPD
jgi:hypothetical protein